MSLGPYNVKVQYYEVLIADIRYQGQDGLSYSSTKKLKRGQIVKVPFRNKSVVGVVIKNIEQPEFKVKEIAELLGESLLPIKLLELIEWLKFYYPAGAGAITSLFLPRGLLLKRSSSPNTSKNRAKKQKLPRLTVQQTDVVNYIKQHQSQQQTFFLHGDTGSGKTRVYIELAKSVLENGKSVLILTPEISLTPQLVSNFEAAFNQEVVVLHSALTATQRKQVWLSVLSSKTPLVVIGPRSALFAPLSNIGLVVVDEAHEAAYKQEQAPHYYAPRVASKLAQLHKALLIFGTATPNITEYYLAQQKKVPILRLSQKALGAGTNQYVKIIGKKERDKFTKHPYLSNDLLEATQSAINKGEQALIFLNRRGTARLVSCQVCDWQALCPNCDLPLTYHGDTHTVRCHTCGYKKLPSINCPVCGSSDIIFASIGTKSIADSLEKLFPKAKVARFDNDNLASERFEKQFSSVASGQIDILVGTQILAKGLDLPNLAVVGVVAAESSLYFPDYTAEERTYQLLRQVIGRVGRGHRRGLAIIQANNPANPAIVSAAGNDWRDFYQKQLDQRQKHNFPPFSYLLKLSCTRKTTNGALSSSQKLAKYLRESGLKIEVNGPAPAFHERRGGHYQWQLIIKAKSRQLLLQVIEQLPSGWAYDIDPLNLL